MISDSNPLDSIWQAYLTVEDCFKVAKRSAKITDLRLISGTQFFNSVDSKIELSISSSRSESYDLFVLALWAIFERFVISYFQIKGEKLKQVIPESLGNRMHARFYDNIEYWRIDEVLDMLKDTIDPNLIGNAKQIKNYRDWIAHRNPTKQPEYRIQPKMAYDLLSKIIIDIQSVAM